MSTIKYAKMVNGAIRMSAPDFDTTTITGSSTAVDSDFTFDTTLYAGAFITYKLRDSTTGAIRVGTLIVATDGTLVSVTDEFAETADLGVTWAGSISGSNAQLTYTASANDKIMKSEMLVIPV